MNPKVMSTNINSLMKEIRELSSTSQNSAAKFCWLVSFCSQTENILLLLNITLDTKLFIKAPIEGKRKFFSFNIARSISGLNPEVIYDITV